MCIMSKKEQQNEETQMEKVPWMHSVRTRITLTMFLSMVAIMAVAIIVSSNEMNASYSSLAKNYMHDLVVYSGKGILGDGVFDEEKAKLLEDVSVEGMESSYAYLVSKDGTMIYHPTAEEIGQPVENEVVKGVVDSMKSGEIPEAKTVEYQFKGTTKYAGYYVTPNGEYILVITCDEDEMMTPIKSFKTKLALICSLLDLVALVVAFILATNIVKPLLQLITVLQKIGKLDFRTDENHEKLNKRQDETGFMSRAIYNMQQDLRTVVEQLSANAKSLYEASEQLGKNASDTTNHIAQIEMSVGEIAEGASSQANETEQATNNVVVIGNMIRDTTEKIAELEKNVQEMKKASNRAGDTLNELGNINEQAKEAIEIIYKQTNMTNESTLKIKEATALITSIADETNLLSLNASIEAARAGENGRGFAVVASQIQKLAEQSNETATHIDEIVNILLEDSQKAVKIMDAVKEVMGKQSQNVEQTETIFKDVEKKVNDSMKEIEGIVTSTNEMDHARVTVVDTVQNLSAIAEENAAGTQQTFASVGQVQSIIENVVENMEKLHKIAENLDEEMERFPDVIKDIVMVWNQE